MKNHHENYNVKIFDSVSRINDYFQRKQAGSFLLFLMSFVSILFFISTAVILHFKLLTEFEREKIKYKKLYKIGITEIEIANIVSKQLKVLFMLPVIFGIIMAISYNYLLPIEDVKRILLIKYSLVLGLIYICFQFLFYLLYKFFYIKYLIKDV